MCVKVFDKKRRTRLFEKFVVNDNNLGQQEWCDFCFHFLENQVGTGQDINGLLGYGNLKVNNQFASLEYAQIIK